MYNNNQMECKSRKSSIWSSRLVWPWSAKQSRAKADSFVRRTCWSQRTPSPVTEGTTLHVNITKGLVPNSGRLYPLQPNIEKLYTVSKSKSRV